MMGFFSYLRSKLSSFILCQILCLNKIVSHHHHQGCLQKLINGNKLQSLSKHVSSVMSFSAVKHMSLLPWRPWLVTNADRYLIEITRLPWRQWIRNPRFVLIGSCALMVSIFGRLERIPYSGRYHFVLPCNMLDTKLGEFLLKDMEEKYKESILPPTSEESIHVQSVLGEIVQAMHSGLRLEKNCSVSVRASKNHETEDMASSGQRQHVSVASTARKLSCDNETSVQRVGKWGGRFATKHLDGLDWEVMVVDSHVGSARYIPNGKIVLFTGMLECLRSDAELATVLGHEVGHGIARHADGGLMRCVWNMALQFIFNAHLSPHPLHNEIIIQLFNSFLSRREELEADYIGLMLMASAGYDPSAAPEVYEVRLGDDSGGLSSTHPSGSKRAQMLNKPKVMQQALAIYKQVISGHGVRSFI